MKIKSILVILVCGCASLQAQERWTLRQCIDYAIEHNIDIRRTANDRFQSRRRFLELR